MTGKLGTFNENGKLVCIVGESTVSAWVYLGDPGRITSTDCISECSTRGCPGMLDGRCPFDRGAPLPRFKELFEEGTMVVKTE